MDRYNCCEGCLRYGMTLRESDASVCPQGGKEYLMRAHFGLPSVETEEVEGRPPIGVKFEIPYFTVSGIQVRNKGGEVSSFPPSWL